MTEATDRAKMRERARLWLYDRANNKLVTRENAIGEDHMALDVLELLDTLAEIAAVLEGLKSAGHQSNNPRFEVGDARYAAGVVDALRWAVGEQPSKTLSKLISMPRASEPTVHGLTRAQLEAQLASAIERQCWWAEDAIRADLRALNELVGVIRKIVEEASESSESWPGDLESPHGGDE